MVLLKRLSSEWYSVHHVCFQFSGLTTSPLRIPLSSPVASSPMSTPTAFLSSLPWWMCQSKGLRHCKSSSLSALATSQLILTLCQTCLYLTALLDLRKTREKFSIQTDLLHSMVLYCNKHNWLHCMYIFSITGYNTNFLSSYYCTCTVIQSCYAMILYI